MSTKKLLKEIKKMTQRGIYPSLSILLEKDEGEKEDDFDMSGSGDEEESETESEDESETESEDESETGEEVEVASKSEGDDEEADMFNADAIKSELNSISALIKSRSGPTKTERELKTDSKYYDLKKFALVLEKNESPETTFKNLQQYLKDFQADSGYELNQVSDVIMGGTEDNVDVILDKALDKSKKSIDIDPYKIIAQDSLLTIRKTFPADKVDAAQKEFLEKYVSALNNLTIDHTISNKYDVKSEKPSKHNIAQGAVKSG